MKQRYILKLSFRFDVVTICSYNHDMNFVWDEAKRFTNQQKHGLDFVDAEIVFKKDIITIEDDRHEYGEVRFITMGMLNTRVVVIVHTEEWIPFGLFL